MPDIFDTPKPEKKKKKQPVPAHLVPYTYKQGMGNQHQRYRGQNYLTVLRKQCEELGFDPVIEAIKRYRDPDTPNSSKDHCLTLLMDRWAPKLKTHAIDKSDSDTPRVHINIISNDGKLQVDQDFAPVLEHEPIDNPEQD